MAEYTGTTGQKLYNMQDMSNFNSKELQKNL